MGEGPGGLGERGPPGALLTLIEPNPASDGATDCGALLVLPTGTRSSTIN